SVDSAHHIADTMFECEFMWTWNCKSSSIRKCQYIIEDDEAVDVLEVITSFVERGRKEKTYELTVCIRLNDDEIPPFYVTTTLNEDEYQNIFKVEAFIID